MASPSIKFRCNDCGQLLGVARAKAGSAISCPKCSATLFVPLTSVEMPPPAEAVRPARAGGISGGSGTGTASWPAGMLIPSPPPTASRPAPEPARTVGSSDALELLDIRPEDIRVEPGFPSKPPDPPPVAPPPPPPRVSPPIAPAPLAAVVAPSRAQGQEDGASDVGMPTIRVDDRIASSPTRRSPAPLSRPSDMVVPRSVVTAWSFLVLLALGMTFVSGLLLGHFVWKVH